MNLEMLNGMPMEKHQGAVFFFCLTFWRLWAVWLVTNAVHICAFELLAMDRVAVLENLECM